MGGSLVTPDKPHKNLPVLPGMSWVNITYTETHLSSKPWFVWRNGGATVTCWLTVTGTLVLWMVMGLPLGVILRRVCLKIALEMLRDLNKNTVDFQDNYDGSEHEPIVLPSRIQTFLSMVRQGLPLVWRRISHHTIWLKQLMLSN